ncbi:hypothetical protein SASPL_139352 [Salvia splendens]|uniref:Uncharacterized protein n=1 Tax=Salvia splendens TaxID=180675 RepID=A0A8X8ZAB7_SALSN|nr:hypothetical protein SASPL_139352 [Salvia splendens]
MLRASSGPHRLFRSLAAKHGPLMHLQLGELHFLIASSAEFAKQVMKTHDTIFANRPLMLATEELAYNSSGITFSPHGDHWRRLRKICTVELLSARHVRSFRRIREEEVTIMCNWIASREGSTIDLSERLYMSSYDVIVRAAVNKAKTEQREMMISILMEIIKLTSGFMLADLYPSVKSLPLITGARFKIRGMRRKLDEVLDGMIEQQRAAADDGDDEAKFEGFLDILLRFEKDGTLTTDNLKAVLLLPLAMLLYHFDWEMPNRMKYEELDMAEGFGATVHRKHHLCLIPIVKRPL